MVLVLARLCVASSLALAACAPPREIDRDDWIPPRIARPRVAGDWSRSRIGEKADRAHDLFLKIEIGMTRKKVHKILGEPLETMHNTEWFFETPPGLPWESPSRLRFGAIEIRYSEDGRVSAREFYGYDGILENPSSRPRSESDVILYAMLRLSAVPVDADPPPPRPLLFWGFQGLEWPRPEEEARLYAYPLSSEGSAVDWGVARRIRKPSDINAVGGLPGVSEEEALSFVRLFTRPQTYFGFEEPNAVEQSLAGVEKTADGFRITRRLVSASVEKGKGHPVMECVEEMTEKGAYRCVRQDVVGYAEHLPVTRSYLHDASE